MIDWTKPIQTKNGKAARYLGRLNTKSAYCHVVAVRDSENEDEKQLYNVSDSGKFCGDEKWAWNIINVPQKHVYWLNVYNPKSPMRHDHVFGQPRRSLESADKNGEGRIACIRIEFTEGEGLE
jgi:hypothetical protein